MGKEMHSELKFREIKLAIQKQRAMKSMALSGFFSS